MSVFICIFYGQGWMDGVVQDGFGRTSGKGLRMIMVNAITPSAGVLATTDSYGFCIMETHYGLYPHRIESIKYSVPAVLTINSPYRCIFRRRKRERVMRGIEHNLLTIRVLRIGALPGMYILLYMYVLYIPMKVGKLRGRTHLRHALGVAGCA